MHTKEVQTRQETLTKKSSPGQPLRFYWGQIAGASAPAFWGGRKIKFSALGTPRYTRPGTQASNSNEERQRERQRKREGRGAPSLPEQPMNPF